MKIKKSKGFTFLIFILLTFLLSACSQATNEKAMSRTTAALAGISEESGIHLKGSMEDDGSQIQVEFYEKADDFYADVTTDGERSILISDKKFVSILNPEEKYYVILPMDDSWKAQIDGIKTSLEPAIAIAGRPDEAYTEGTIKIGDDEYKTEEYDFEGMHAIFAFDAGANLRAIVTNAENVETVVMIQAFDGDVPDEIFLIPDGYLQEKNDNIIDAPEKTEDTAPGGNSPEDNGMDLGDYLVFSSEEMQFSFVYDPANKAVKTATGAAQLVIGEDSNLVGLFVSVQPEESMPAPEEILEEDVFNLQQQYQNAMIGQPEMDTISIEGHDVTGIVYAYSDTTGFTVDCTEFIEVRDGHYVFYKTAAHRENGGPELEAMGLAMESIAFSVDAYGPSNATSGSVAANTAVGNDAVASGKAAAGTTPEDNRFESGFLFSADADDLVISDQDITQVYVHGVMEGDYFTCERVAADTDIGEKLVRRQEEVRNFLQERTVSAPEYQTLTIGSRKLAGIEYAFSSVDGAKTLCGVEYYESLGGEVYCWSATYTRGDDTAPDALLTAMETFVVQ